MRQINLSNDLQYWKYIDADPAKKKKKRKRKAGEKAPSPFDSDADLTESVCRLPRECRRLDNLHAAIALADLPLAMLMQQAFELDEIYGNAEGIRRLVAALKAIGMGRRAAALTHALKERAELLGVAGASLWGMVDNDPDVAARVQNAFHKAGLQEEVSASSFVKELINCQGDDVQRLRRGLLFLVEVMGSLHVASDEKEALNDSYKHLADSLAELEVRDNALQSAFAEAKILDHCEVESVEDLYHGEELVSDLDLSDEQLEMLQEKGFEWVMRVCACY